MMIGTFIYTSHSLLLWFTQKKN